MNPYLFVYGTLRRNPSGTHRLLGQVRFVARGSISGRLYDLGKYPAVSKTAGRDGRVTGELYELTGSDVDGRLAKIDRHEGSEFRRCQVLVRLDDGRRRRAWAYILAGAPPRGAQEIRTGVYEKRGHSGRAA